MDTALWVMGRATGVVALLLLTVVVVLGIATRSGRPISSLPRFGVQLVHRNAALLATVFVVIHVVSLLLDPQAQLRAVDLVIPFVGVDKPIWLGLGTTGVDLLIAILITSLLRRLVGRRVFRVLHWLSYPLWVVSIAHTLGTGSDAATPWLIGVTVLCCLAVVLAIGWRVSARFRRMGAAAGAVVPLEQVR